MKTQKNSNPNLPSPVKFSVYLLVVAAVCFLNWSALKASDNEKADANTLETRLEAALVPVAEAEIELEDWMLNIADEVAIETEIELEDWMLEVPERKLVLRNYHLAEVADPAPVIEDWMVNTETWANIEFLAEN
jgi:hypothetical protein